MKYILLMAVLGMLSVQGVIAKSYKITKEDDAFKDAEKQNKLVAYVFG